MLSDIYNCEAEDTEDEIVEELWHRLPNNGLGLESSSWECICKQLSTQWVGLFLILIQNI